MLFNDLLISQEMIPSTIPSTLTLDHWIGIPEGIFLILSVFKPRFFSLEQMKTSLSSIFLGKSMYGANEKPHINRLQGS